jgi:hypothetical protein
MKHYRSFMSGLYGNSMFCGKYCEIFEGYKWEGIPKFVGALTMFENFVDRPEVIEIFF